MSLAGPEQPCMNYRRPGHVLIAGGNVDVVVQMIDKRRGKESRLNVQSSCRWISRFVGLFRVWV